MILFKKRLVIPSTEKIEIEAVESWSVRWFSRYGSYSGDIREEVEVFINKDEAALFAQSLRDAFKLIRQENKIEVRLIKN